MFGDGWCVTLAAHPLAETLRLMGVTGPVPCPEGVDQAARFLQESQGEGAFLLGRELPGGWTLIMEFETWIGFGDEVLRTLAAGGQTAVSAYRDPDTKTAAIAHDGAILGQLDLTGGYFDGLSGSVDTAHPVLGSLTAAGFDASDACVPTGEADTEEPDGCLILAVRVLTGITLTSADFEGTAGQQRHLGHQRAARPRVQRVESLGGGACGPGMGSCLPQQGVARRRGHACGPKVRNRFLPAAGWRRRGGVVCAGRGRGGGPARGHGGAVLCQGEGGLLHRWVPPV